jgi:hypothetical protein
MGLMISAVTLLASAIFTLSLKRSAKQSVSLSASAASVH